MEIAGKYIAKSDFSLSRFLFITSPKYHFIYLNEIDGWCILAPRNIKVNDYENLTLPFDSICLFLLLTSIFLITLLWKIMKNLQNQPMNLVDLLFNIFDMLIGSKVEDQTWTRWTKKEKFLIFPFLFAQIILIGLYQSWVVAYMISKPSMRGAETFTELNSTNTKIYQYYQELEIQFKRENIMEFVNVTDSDILRKVPENFNRNFAYTVPCQYADNFIQSPLNIDENGEKIFDKIEEQLTKVQTLYLVNENYPLRKELQFMVEALLESGIRSFWLKEASRNFTRIHVDDESEGIFIQLLDMQFVFDVVLYGGVVGGVVLLIEIFFKFLERKIERLGRRISFL